MHIVHVSPNKDAPNIDSVPEYTYSDDSKKKHPLGKLAVQGLIFDTTNFDKVSDETVAAIDKFFDSF